MWLDGTDSHEKKIVMDHEIVCCWVLVVLGELNEISLIWRFVFNCVAGFSDLSSWEGAALFGTWLWLFSQLRFSANSRISSTDFDYRRLNFHCQQKETSHRHSLRSGWPLVQCSLFVFLSVCLSVCLYVKVCLFDHPESRRFFGSWLWRWRK